MNTIENLQQSMDSLRQDYQQRMAALQQAQDIAAAAIAESGRLEAATAEQQAKAQAKVQALDGLNDALSPILSALQSIRSEADAMRDNVAYANRLLKEAQQKQAQLNNRLLHLAPEVGKLARANGGAFDNVADLRTWVDSWIRNHFDFTTNNVGDDHLPYKVRSIYSFRAMDYSSLQMMVASALSMIR